MSSERRLSLAREWDDLVDQVRAREGFADFLRPSPAPVPAGPVVVLNVSRWGCDALLVRPDRIEHLPLPGLTAAEVADRTDRYLRAVGGETVDEDELRDCLVWMWDSFAGPVLDRLAGAPRVWWCPTGALTLLPIHAAGRHDEPGASVLDRVISSYTPTVRALRAGPPPTTPGKLLFVGQADALPSVDRERETLRALLPDSVFLDGDRATRAAVFDQLAGHSWAHFSCHGVQNLDDPASGGLVLADGIATVAEFGERAYRGELAFLAGCQTAVGGRVLPDEAITLAAALHHAGFRHVVATMWTVRDATVARVTRQFYRWLLHDGCPPAAALHDAVRGLRARHPRSPSAWTPFAHTGP